MKRYDYLSTSKLLLLGYGLLMLSTGTAGILPEQVQIHGYVTQDFFHSSDNNVYGQSDDGISPGRTEIGLNIAYQPWSRLSLSVQGLYRRAGRLDRGSVRVDYGVADLNLFNYQHGHVGIRGGRIKIPYGLYNETRDVAFTTPTLLLPQGIYYDRSRSLTASADGGSLYAQHRTDWGNFSVKFNAGIALGDHQEIKYAFLGPNAKGKFISSPGIATQLNYELNGGEYIAAVSYVSLKLNYHPTANDIFASGYTTIKPLVFSAQYNGEKLGLTAEYVYRWNRSKNYAAIADNESVSESWYIQGSYRLMPQLQGIARFETLSQSLADRGGSKVAKVGLPKHIAYAKDWTVGLRWEPVLAWMLRAEYHRIHGTAWLAQADNRQRSKTHENWDLYSLQLSYRF